MLEWILILAAIVIVLGYLQSRKAKERENKEKEEFMGCAGGCSGCAGKDMCQSNKNNEKK